MSEAQRQSSSNASAMKSRSSWAMTSYVIATVVACGAMAWYFFIFVPSKLEYFTGLRFRTMVVAAGQVRSKIESLQAALELAEAGVRQQGTSAGIGLSNQERQQVATYLNLLVPQMRLDDSQSSTGFLFSAPALTGTVAWESIVDEAKTASQENFEDLLLASSDGKVVWQREKTTPRIGDIGELLKAEVPSEGPKGPDKDKQAIPETAFMKSVNLNGRPSSVIVEAIRLSKYPGKPLYIAGLVSQDGLQRQARHIPMAWIVFFVGLLFLGFPFVKLATVAPKERYRFSDVMLLAGTAILAANMGAMLPFVPVLVDSNEDARLADFATKIEGRLKDETGRILDLAKLIEENRSAVSLRACEVDLAATNLGKKRCGLWEALNDLKGQQQVAVEPGTLELDVVAWIDDQGRQLQKWSTKRQVTAPAQHVAYNHFRDLQSGKLWKLEGRSDAFTIDPVRSLTTSDIAAIFAVPALKRPPLAAAGSLGFVLNVRPSALVDVVVPPGYGFAILAEDGTVLFHSQAELTLQENFFDEILNRENVRQGARSAGEFTWSGDYHGRPRRLYMRPMWQFIGCPWRIVTFRSTDPLLATQSQQLAGILYLCLINLFVLGAVTFLFWQYCRLNHQEFRDTIITSLAPGPRGRESAQNSVGMLVILSLLATLVFLFTYKTTAQYALDALFAFFLFLPVLAVVIALSARLHGIRSLRHIALRILRVAGIGPRTIAIMEPGLLLFLIGVIPAAGFSRVVYRVETLQQTELWLQEAAQRWSSRQDHLRERLSGAIYSAATKDLLKNGIGKLDVESLPSYLSVVQAKETTPVGEEAKGSYPFRRPPGILKLLRWSLASPNNEVGSQASFYLVDADKIGIRLDGSTIALAAQYIGSWSDDFSIGGAIAGVLVLIMNFSALYWAGGKLAQVRSVPSLDLHGQLKNIAESQINEGILLIGPPRTTKDQIVKRTLDPVWRISLQDAKLNDASIAHSVERVNAEIVKKSGGDASKRLWIQLSNLEAQLVTSESRTMVLQLFEKLLKHYEGEPLKGLIVTSNVDPIGHFSEIFEHERKNIYGHTIPEVELSRSSLLLSRFRRCYQPLAGEQPWARPGIQVWKNWLNYDPNHWMKTAQLEVEACAPLAGIVDELEAQWRHRPQVPLRELARAIETKARAYYELLWTSCTRSEKLVLIQLAQEGLINPKSRDVMTQLVAKGLIIEHSSPAIFNYTFRTFLREIERDEVVTEWEGIEGSGLWVLVGRLVGSTLIVGGLFFLLTQDFSIQWLIPLILGSGLFGIPMVRDLIASFSKKSGATAPERDLGLNPLKPDTPDSLEKALLSQLWKSQPWLRNVVLVLAFILVIAFAIWASLPDDVKRDIIDKLR